jgi:hypothetical protein
MDRKARRARRRRSREKRVLAQHALGNYGRRREVDRQLEPDDGFRYPGIEEVARHLLRLGSPLAQRYSAAARVGPSRPRKLDRIQRVRNLRARLPAEQVMATLLRPELSGARGAHRRREQRVHEVRPLQHAHREPPREKAVL